MTIIPLCYNSVVLKKKLVKLLKIAFQVPCLGKNRGSMGHTQNQIQIFQKWQKKKVITSFQELFILSKYHVLTEFTLWMILHLARYVLFFQLNETAVISLSDITLKSMSMYFSLTFVKHCPNNVKSWRKDELASNDTPSWKLYTKNHAILYDSGLFCKKLEYIFEVFFFSTNTALLTTFNKSPLKNIVFWC